MPCAKCCWMPVQGWLTADESCPTSLWARTRRGPKCSYAWTRQSRLSRRTKNTSRPHAACFSTALIAAYTIHAYVSQCVCVCACVSCRYAPCLSEDPVQQTRCRSRQEESQDGRPRGVSGTSVSFLPARGHMQVGALACACIATHNIAACFKRFECRRMPCISLNVGQGQRGAWDPL